MKICFSLLYSITFHYCFITVLNAGLLFITVLNADFLLITVLNAGLLFITVLNADLLLNTVLNADYLSMENAEYEQIKCTEFAFNTELG